MQGDPFAAARASFAAAKRRYEPSEAAAEEEDSEHPSPASPAAAEDPFAAAHLRAQELTRSEPFNVAHLFHKLPSKRFGELKAEWAASGRRHRGGEMDRETFCSVLIPYCRDAFPAVQERQLVEALRELFGIVDAARTGFIGWEPFTDHIVEQAIRGQPNVVDKVDNVLRYHYRQNEKQAGTIPCINQTLGAEDVCRRLLYFPSVHRLLVCSRLNRAKLCDPAADFAVVKTLPTDVPIIDACYVRRPHVHVGEQHVLLTTSADLRIRTWKGELQDYATGPVCTQQETQMVLRWCDHSELLFTGARNGDILVWTLAMNEELRQVSRSMGHTQPVMDIFPASKTRKIFSVSLDKTLLQWDSARMGDPTVHPLEFKGYHKKGLYSVQYLDEYKMVLTAGFEFHISCWMEGQPLAKPFKLTDPTSDNGHKHSILRVINVPGTPQVISCDRAGLAKVWDLRMFLPCQTWSVIPEGHRVPLEKGGKVAALQASDPNVITTPITDFVFLERSRELLFNTPRQTFLYSYDGRAHVVALRRLLKDSPLKADSVKEVMREKRAEIINMTGLSRHLATHSQAAQSLREDLSHARTQYFERKEQLRQLRRHMDEQIDPSCAHEQDSPVVLALYNAARAQFLTAGGSEIKIWDGVTGDVVTYLKGLFGGLTTITAGCAEPTGRKFVLGTADGRVGLFRFANCGMVREYLPRGNRWDEVTAVAYMDEERMVVAAVTPTRGEGGALHIWSDANLRSGAVQQHVAPLKSLRLNFLCKVLRQSSRLGLLLAGDEGGVVTCLAFDGQIASTSPPSVVHRCEPPSIDAGECCALCSLAPYTAFAVADAAGMINLWSVRPYVHGDLCLARWENVPHQERRAWTSPQAHLTMPNVTALAWHYPYTIYTGDEHGKITGWNVADIIDSAQLRRDARPGPRGTEPLFPRPQWEQAPSPTVLVRWRAHDDALRSVQFLPDEQDARVSILISLAHGNTVAIWQVSADTEWVKLGALTLHAGLPGAPPWAFRPPRGEQPQSAGRQSDVGKAAITEWGRARLRAVPAFVHVARRRRRSAPGPSPGSPDGRALSQQSSFGSPQSKGRQRSLQQRLSLRKVSLPGMLDVASPDAGPTTPVNVQIDAPETMSNCDDMSNMGLRSPPPRMLRVSIFEHLATTDAIAEDGSEVSSPLEFGADPQAALRKRRNMFRRASRARQSLPDGLSVDPSPDGPVSTRGSTLATDARSRTGQRSAHSSPPRLLSTARFGTGGSFCSPGQRRSSALHAAALIPTPGAVDALLVRSPPSASRASRSPRCSSVGGDTSAAVQLLSPRMTVSPLAAPSAARRLSHAGQQSRRPSSAPASRPVFEHQTHKRDRWLVSLRDRHTAVRIPADSAPGVRGAVAAARQQKMLRAQQRSSRSPTAAPSESSVPPAPPAAESPPPRSPTAPSADEEPGSGTAEESEQDECGSAAAGREEVSLRLPQKGSKVVLRPVPVQAHRSAESPSEAPEQQPPPQQGLLEPMLQPPPRPLRRRETVTTRQHRAALRRAVPVIQTEDPRFVPAQRLYAKLGSAVARKRQRLLAAAQAPLVRRAVHSANVTCHTTAYVSGPAPSGPAPKAAAVAAREGRRAELCSAVQQFRQRQRAKRADAQHPKQLQAGPISWK